MKQAPALAMITGRPAAFTWGGIIKPSLFGQTSLEVRGGRIIEITRTVTGERQRELLLAELDSAEVVTRGNSMMFVIGLFTFWMLGLGILLMLLSFAFKEQYLMICTKTNRVSVLIKGDDKPYRQFLDSVLRLAENVKQYAREPHDVA